MAGGSGTHVSRDVIHEEPLESQALLTPGSVGFDRDLSIAGRVMIKSKGGEFAQKLVKIERPSM